MVRGRAMTARTFTPRPSPGEFSYRVRTDLPGDVAVVAEVSTSLDYPWLSGAANLEVMSSEPDTTDPNLKRVMVRPTLAGDPSAVFFRISLSEID